MGRIKGITVTLITETESGTDPFGVPTVTETETKIENVLVAPVSQDERLTEQDLTGAQIVYKLGIPKADTHNWYNKKVKIWGETYKTVGEVERGIDELIPLEWNRNVNVERFR